MKKIDIPKIFKSDASDLIKAREDAISIHGADIRAAGNEVEISVRNYLHRMLPSIYYVTHGHLIDIHGSASPQLDFIVSDTFNLPSLMTTKDGTEFVPIDSVYAIGEIKSTYYRSKKYIQQFSEVIHDMRKNLFHEDIPNTAFEGLKADSLMRDILLAKGNRVLNRIFSFILFIDSGDFQFEEIASFFTEREDRYLPNLTVILNEGVIIHGCMEDDGFHFTRYPEDTENEDRSWYFLPMPVMDTGSLEGNHLGFLYYSLVEHITNSYLGPPNLKTYIEKMMVGRKSLTFRADAI